MGKVALALVAAYLLAAYLVLPALWRHFEYHPAMAGAPKTTLTADGIPGDPLNVGLVGSESEVIHALLSAGWRPADPVTLETSLAIAASVLFKRDYVTAPVSDLYLFGRPQDLAFERPVTGGPGQRHHVRLWRSDELGLDGRPLWIGTVTFDRGVGVSHYTGKFTHHIAPDVDGERDELVANVAAARQLVVQFQVTGIGARFTGRNGGGDPYFTDGELTVGILSPGNVEQAAAPKKLANPTVVSWKNRVMRRLRSLLK